MKYEVGQIVKIKDDILCVGDKQSDIFFESEIMGAIE